MKKRTYKCCLCGNKYEGYGNNPWPISLDEEDRCCDMCNVTKVIPARIDLMHRKEANSNNEEV